MFSRKLVYSTILLLLFAAFGCDSLKDPEMSISVNPSTIAAGGIDYAEVSVFLKIEGDPAKGKNITFETTNGSFSSSSELTSTEIATDDTGYAVARLYSSLQQGEATVTATFEDPDSGESFIKTVTVTFGPPSSNSLPMAGNFNLDCDYLNVGALTSAAKPDIQVNCEVTARSVKGDVIPPESLTFAYFAEAGELTGGYDDNEGMFIVKYSVRGGDALPQDVEPLSGEPSRPCAGKTCNPRDGLVTLMIVTSGAERYQDNNGNGVWDSNEPFDDLPEPFLDKNDNGQWDPGEPYFDTDGNGEYSEANGIFDEETKISAIFKIIWSGKPEENETAAYITHSPSTTNLPDGGSMSVTVRMVDINLNPVASFPDAGDTVFFIDSLGGLNPTSPASNPGFYTLENTSAIALDSEGRFLSYDETAADCTVNFADSSPGSDPEDDALPFLVGVGASLSPGPDESQSFTQYTFDFLDTISGTVK